MAASPEGPRSRSRIRSSLIWSSSRPLRWRATWAPSTRAAASGRSSFHSRCAPALSLILPSVASPAAPLVPRRWPRRGDPSQREPRRASTLLQSLIVRNRPPTQRVKQFEQFLRGIVMLTQFPAQIAGIGSFDHLKAPITGFPGSRIASQYSSPQLRSSRFAGWSRPVIAARDAEFGRPSVRSRGSLVERRVRAVDIPVTPAPYGDQAQRREEPPWPAQRAIAGGFALRGVESDPAMVDVPSMFDSRHHAPRSTPRWSHIVHDARRGAPALSAPAAARKFRCSGLDAQRTGVCSQGRSRVRAHCHHRQHRPALHPELSSSGRTSAAVRVGAKHAVHVAVVSTLQKFQHSRPHDAASALRSRRRQ